MKITTLTKSMAILLTGILMVASEASAVITTYAADDLIMGFSQDGNTSSYVLNIGQVLQYRTATGSIVLNTSALTDNGDPGTITGIGSAAAINNDLTLVFGANWATDPTVHWGIVGTPGASDKIAVDTNFNDPANTLYASSTSTTPNSTYDRNLSASQSGPRGSIIAMANTGTNGASYRGSTVLTSGFQSPVGVRELSSVAGNWEKFVDGTASQSLTGSFNYFTGGTFLGTPATSTTLDLFRIQPSDADVPGGQGLGTGLGQIVGAFTINTSGPNLGTITFNPTAVPEPSRALLLVGGIVSLFMRRRRPAATV